MRKNTLIFALCAMFSLGIAVGCNGDDNSAVPEPTYSIALDTYTLNMDLFGGEKEISVKTLKDNVETTGAVEWESQDTSVVTVADGKLTPIGVGETYVVAQWAGVTEQCLVVVQMDSVPVLQIDSESLGFIYNVSQPYPLDSWVLYRNEEYRTEIGVTYQIPEEGQQVAQVDEDGVITPVGIGETELIIQATFRNYSGIGMSKRVPISVFQDVEVHATVENNNPEDLYVQEVDYEGVTYHNTASLTYRVDSMSESGLIEIVGANVEWKTSNADVATVSADGQITAVGAGECEVWCEYTANGYASLSNEIKVAVNPYAVVKTLDARFVFDKANEHKIPTKTEVFGEEYVGEIERICLNQENLFNGEKISVAGLADGMYTFDIVNSDGYAYTLQGAIASYTATQDGVEFALLRGKKQGNIQYYNVLLPDKENLFALTSLGYKALAIGYYCEVQNTALTVTATAKYKSELNQTLIRNEDDTFLFNLNVFLDRYDEMDEFSISEYAFKVDETSANLRLTSLEITTEAAEKEYVDFKIDRQLKIGNFTMAQEIEKDGVVAQAVGTGTVSADGNIFVLSEQGVSKETVAEWLNAGYETLRVKYYLEYDATRMTKPIQAFAHEAYNVAYHPACMGEEITLAANQWAVAEFSLARFYAMRSSNDLFAFYGLVADDGSPMQYTMYIESIIAVDASDEPYDIRMYAGYPVEMYVQGGSPKGVNEYEKQVEGKTANFYTTFDVQGHEPWNGSIAFFTALNVTVEQLKRLRDEGYTTLDFEVYAKTSNGLDIQLRMNPEGKPKGSELHQWTITSGEWTVVKVELNLLIDYYARLNKAGDGQEFWYMKSNGIPEGLETVIYELGVAKITPAKN